MTFPNSVLKVGADWLAVGVYLTAGTCVKPDAIQKACTRSFRAPNHAHAYMNPADMLVRNKLVGRIVESVMSS